MSRINQVIQVGEIQGNTHCYIEDYAYTYLKKQKGKEKTKYFLYGEKEEYNQQNKIYIYGISEKPKLEQTYFKEYYPLGFLKIKDEEMFWIDLNGEEEKICGFYVFYAPNQAMQEYLVDHREDIKEDEPLNKIKRSSVQEVLPVKEVMVPNGKLKIKRKINGRKKDKMAFPFGPIVIAILLMFILTTTNGQKKIEIFKQVIAETMSNSISENEENTIIIEEKNSIQTSGEREENIDGENNKDTNIEELNIENRNSTKIEEVSSLTEDNKNITKETSQIEDKLECEENTSQIEDTQINEKEKLWMEDKQKNKEEIARIEDNRDNEEETTQDDSKIVEETKIFEKTVEEQEKDNYEEYIVKKGDTLDGICKRRYGSLLNKTKICDINNIENEDHISPGQKLYLP